MFVPKNTLVRNNAKKILKDEGLDLLIDKMENHADNPRYHQGRRLNQMIKKRVTSMLKGNVLDIIEVADLLDLIDMRMELDGNGLKSSMIARMRLADKYGSYSKMFTSVSDIDSDEDFGVPYTVSGKTITDHAHKSYMERAYNEEGK